MATFHGTCPICQEIADALATERTRATTAALRVGDNGEPVDAHGALLAVTKAKQQARRLIPGVAGDFAELRTALDDLIELASLLIKPYCEHDAQTAHDRLIEARGWAHLAEEKYNAFRADEEKRRRR